MAMYSVFLVLCGFVLSDKAPIAGAGAFIASGLGLVAFAIALNAEKE